MTKIIQYFPDIIEGIIKNKTHLFFISPHPDDAIFSAGGLISYLAGKTPITIINVFTSFGDGKNTLSAKAYLNQCQAGSPQKLFETKLREDFSVFSKLNLQAINLEFVDALWRKTQKKTIIKNLAGKIFPEFNRLYSTYRLHIVSGNINKEDRILEKQISDKLKKIISKNLNKLIFCPSGFGNHVDHLIVRDVCKRSFNGDVVYWSDFPYYLNLDKLSIFTQNNGLSKFVYKVTTDEKKQLCHFYESQINKINKTSFYKEETYYLEVNKENNFYTEISDNLDEKSLREWRMLWEESSLKHFFNSPVWFLACQKVFKYSKTTFIKCYENLKLVGILPVVLTKKYSVSAYSFAGNQYLDKSSVLLVNNNLQILDILINRLAKLGNYFLIEIEGSLLDISLLKQKIGIVKSSACPFLPLSANPYQYLNSYNRKKIVKKIEELEADLKFKIFTDIEEGLKIMLEVESESSKVKEFKNVLSDPNFRKLYHNLGMLKPGSILISVLYYKEEPICYRSGFINGSVYHGNNTAYKVAYAHLMPGKISVFLLLSQLSKMGIKLVDFSRGNNPLKRDLTPYSYEQYLVFHSQNPLIMFWWKMLYFLKNYLEAHPFLFETVRWTKRWIGSKVFNLTGSLGKNLRLAKI